mgnify:FL=1
MIKKLIKTTTLLLSLLFIAACSDSDTPQQGKHYNPIANDLSAFDLAPITEVFSLTCGHCKNMEQYIPEIEKLTNQSVGKVHVTFNQSATISAMIYYTAEMQLNQKPDPKMLEELFAAVQQRDVSKALQQANIEKVYTSRGLVSPYSLNKTQSDELLKRVSVAELISEQAQIESVPSFIIKGKYILNTDEHDDIQQLANTINHLLSDSKY